MRPPEIRAGDSLTWRVTGYPAEAGWTFHYALRGPSSIDIEAIDDGGEYLVEVAASTTAAWAPGWYRWVAYVLHTDGDRVTLDDGRLEILPDLLSAEAGDVRSHAQRMLELIEAALEKRIPKDQQSYEIDGQRLDRIPVERLEALRTRYRNEVRRETRQGDGLGIRTLNWRM